MSRNWTLFGKKIGMTREFYETGQSVPVTVDKNGKSKSYSSYRKRKTRI